MKKTSIWLRPTTVIFLVCALSGISSFADHTSSRIKNADTTHWLDSLKSAEQLTSQDPVPKLGSYETWQPFVTNLFSLNDRYRVGDEWGKIPVDEHSLRNNPVYRRVVLSTGKINATGFYLGKFAGHHIMATNHHVCPSEWSCEGSTFRFTERNLRFRITHNLISDSSIDLALLAIRVPPEQEQLLEGIGQNFAWRSQPYPGQMLITAGYGVANNPQRQMMVNQDSDCKTFSARGDIRRMADPDRLNPGPYKAWSFAIGCDVSHGDSGSAIWDRINGELIGIVWTGKIPKSQQAQRSEWLDEILQRNDPAIWTELTYAVPAAKMYDVLQARLASGGVPANIAEILRAILNN